MTEPIVYIDTSRVQEGKLDDLQAAINELAEFVDANEPHILSYKVYFTHDRSVMTVMHLHRDSDSLLFHMKTAGHLFPRFADLLDLQSIDVYGNPTPELVEMLREKAKTLGTGKVSLHQAHGGFVRFL